MIEKKSRRDAQYKRAVKKKERLHLIESFKELMRTFAEIEEPTSCAKKVEKKRRIIREQVNIRKKLLNHCTL